MENNNVTELYQLLVAQFSVEELQDLCFRLGVDYESLPPVGKTTKARELVLFMQRRGRLDELEAKVSELRQAAGSTSDRARIAPAPPPASGVQLSREDFDRLVGILASLPEFRSSMTRLDFLDDVFAGLPRKDDVLGLINVDGTPRAVAVRVVTRLTQFGRAEPGEETLAVLINRLLTYMGTGPDAEFLRSLFNRYPLKGDPAATRSVDDWHGREAPEDVQEKVIGENTLRDIRMLELALEASRAVVRIRTDVGLGTGFLAGAGLVMTNHHVIRSEPSAQDSMFTFNYQLDRQRQPVPVQTTRALPDGLFYTNEDLDFTVVELEEVPDGVEPLTLVAARVQRDERVNIIQHPGGHYKKFSMQNNFVAFANARDLQYLTTTEPGSSGSPVFNNDFEVVGIHHSGGELFEPDSNRRYLRNAGSSMIAVLEDLRVNAPDVFGRLRVR